MLTEIGKLTDAQVPEHWPQNCRLNPRAFSKLPDGWYHAKMVTGESGRGTGGNMARLFVGPYDEAKGKRVQFWHKTDLEKHLGYKLEQESEENPRIHPRIMNPELLKTFPDDAILHRVHEKKARADYINKRCDDLDGKTVREALMDFHYEYEGGIMCSYGSSDLKYDEKDGRI
ncbi:unnamed protein product [Polarella glacialis]|uniref:Uncharacterized protein n=1 Tax=Polarella glacialis TaxID=89957 RepID=A0A813EF78_POLGL|nr:unnamed protein product [Polarella glacialis]